VELTAAAIPLWASTELSGAVLWIGCGLGWTLLVLALIDLRCFRLPDALTLPLLVAGLIVTALVWPADLPDHLLGSVLGYTALAAIGWIYRSMRGRDGLGLGDAKLLAAGGAWVSWKALSSIVTIAAALALTVVLVTWTLRGLPPSATTRMPFGAFLAGAIWLIWLYGPLAF